MLLDVGSGASRLLGRPELLEGADRLEIVLTHFHLDHVVGLSYLPGIDLEKRVWATGACLYGADSAAVLGRLVAPPFFGVELEDVVGEVVEIEGPEFEIGPLRMRARVQERHTHPTLALRVGDDLAYCTDTAYDEANADFAAGARLLCHEAWHAAPETADEVHTASGEAARIAREAGVGELVLIHVNPLLRSDDELLADAVSGFDRATVGADLLEWSTPA